MRAEWVQLKATLHALDNPEFQCGPCLQKYKSRPQQFEFKGCAAVRPTKLFSIDDKIHFRTCIGNFFSQTMAHWVYVHSQYEKGFLPFPGCLNDQPNKVMDVFHVISNHNMERMASLQKKTAIESKLKRPKRGG